MMPETSIDPRTDFKIVSSAKSFVMERLRSLRENRGGQIPALDGLRAVAITLVIAAHSKYDFVAAGGNPSPTFLYDAIGFGWAGVDLFFVLSGFLIGKILLDEFRRENTIQVGAFLLRRGLRIWPLYFFVCAVSLLAMGWTHRFPGWNAVLPDLLLLTNYFGERLAYGSWSLSVEEQFYVIVPILLLAFGRRLNKGPARASWLFAGMFFLAPVFRYFLLPEGGETELFRNSILTHYDGLVIGLFLSSIFVYTESGAAIRKHLGLLLGILTVLAGVLTYLFPSYFQFSLLGLLFGSWVWRSLDRPRAPLSRLLAWPGFQIISRLSYGMYLWYRFPLWRIAQGVVERIPVGGPHLHFFLIFGLTFLFAMAAATVTYICVEAPFLALRSRLRLSSRLLPQTSNEIAASIVMQNKVVPRIQKLSLEKIDIGLS